MIETTEGSEASRPGTVSAPRRAYADWSFFDEDRRMLTRSHVELNEMPQRMGASRKNAADIKMAVDAMEPAFEREYISTFAICTGDSDFTPLVPKLRELNKRVIGVGVEKSTSALLPPACDEFLYYDRLEGVESHSTRTRRSRVGRVPAPEQEPETQPVAAEPAPDVDTLAVLVAQTLAGLQGSSSGAVTASTLTRTLLRKDPTFSESDLRVPHLRGVAAAPCRPQRRRAGRGTGQRRPGRLPARARRRGGRVRPVAIRGPRHRR